MTQPGVVFVRVADPVEPVGLQMAWREASEVPGLSTVLAVSDEVLPDAAVATDG